MKRILSVIIALLFVITIPVNAATDKAGKTYNKGKAKIEKKVDIELKAVPSVINGQQGYTLTALVPRRGSYINFKWVVKNDGRSTTYELTKNKPIFNGGSGKYRITADFIPAINKKYIITFTATMGAGNSKTVFKAEKSIELKGINIAEPEKSKYEFKIGDIPAIIKPQNNIIIPVALRANHINQSGYDKVRVKVTYSAPAGGILNLWAKDSNNVMYDAAKIGFWGPANGFIITKDYNTTTYFTARFGTKGKYTINLDLLNLNNNTVIASKSFTVNVSAAVDDITITNLAIKKLSIAPYNNSYNLYKLSVEKLLVTNSSGTTSEVTLNPSYLVSLVSFDKLMKSDYILTIKVTYKGYTQSFTLTGDQILALL
jgi:hypothetical protein